MLINIRLVIAGWIIYRNWTIIMFCIKTCKFIELQGENEKNSYRCVFLIVLKSFDIICLIEGYSFQSIPANMEFDPNSNPPCYKNKEEVNQLELYLIKYLPPLL